MGNIIKANKKTLLLVAGLVWLVAGFRVFTLGQIDVNNNNANIIIILGIAIVVYYLFFNFIFSKMLKKHIKRILSHESERRCIFAFFDKKSYIIMGCMMFFGITIRSLNIFNPVYLGSFYMGLGGALFTSGVLFLINCFNFENTKLKYNN
ncbi:MULTISPECIES: hypothetical protein [unclassified Romboutsia]|uniref:hypothetical protein n=1 Tax=unclassified Romboutsia TaxID=2626894 RepID=UPI0008230929|nr:MULTISPECIES: hypothetical protein [unclassified Romboutsia]SCI15752.1 Uncharacterised protein [uncultured Clostridium sp.]